MDDIGTTDVNARIVKKFPVISNGLQGVNGNIKMPILRFITHVRGMHQATICATFTSALIESTGVMERKTKPLSCYLVLGAYGYVK